jgi:hypothetical protein
MVGGVDPVSLTVGAVVAALAKRAADRAADGTESALRRGLAALRRRFAAAGDDAVVGALDLVEQAPDSPRSLEALARVLDNRARDAAVRGELERLIATVAQDGEDVGVIAQQAWGDQNVQIGRAVDSSISVSYGSPAPPKLGG